MNELHAISGTTRRSCLFLRARPRVPPPCTPRSRPLARPRARRTSGSNSRAGATCGRRPGGHGEAGAVPDLCEWAPRVLDSGVCDTPVGRPRRRSGLPNPPDSPARRRQARLDLGGPRALATAATNGADSRGGPTRASRRGGRSEAGEAAHGRGSWNLSHRTVPTDQALPVSETPRQLLPSRR
jgi:hypothetical protein